MSTILFVCQHGGAKSVIAASYFNRSGLPISAVAAAAEEPYEGVPEPVVELLAREGDDVRAFKPRRVEEEDFDAATKIVSIGCGLSGAPGSQPGIEDVDGLRARRSREDVIERWDDVPPASEDLEGSAAAIRRHVDALVAELRGRL